ncbi:MAG: ABC transporter permease [Rhodothermales bacterium]
MRTRNAFDLETAIATWRAFFQQRRAFFTEDLEELELHLREHTAHLMECGLSEEEAFRQATAHLGNVVLLDDAFKEVFWSKIKHKGRLLRTLAFQYAMFNNYLKTALRNLLRHKGYSALNISGLVVGMASAFLILIWISNELGVDQFHEHADRLYQVKVNSVEDAGIATWSNAPMPLAAALEQDVPDVRSAVLMLPVKAVLQRDDYVGREEGYHAGPAFFEMFTFPLLAGDPASALDAPGSIVISEQMAIDYFGAGWDHAVGSTLTLHSWQSNGGVLGNAIHVEAGREYLVTGVLKDVPANSSLDFDFILPVQEVANAFPHITSWGPRWFELYVLFEAETAMDGLQATLAPLLTRHVEDATNQALIIQPFVETYLHGSFVDGRAAGGRIQRIYLIGLTGLAILLIACINFTNLITARSNLRAREIGVRKSLGATPGFLVQQFLGESVITALLSMIGAVVLMLALLPTFSGITGTALTAADLTSGHWMLFILVALLTGLLAGGYPAFRLSNMQAIRNLRGQSGGQVRNGRSGTSARESLVVVQFAISAFLIVGTLTIHDQIQYLQSADLGLDKENVLMMPVEGALANNREGVRAQLLQSTAIESTALSSANPLGVAMMNSNVRWEGKEEGEDVLFTVLETDEHMATTMAMTITDGRFFDPGKDTGQLHYVVNETAVRALGLDAPVGHPFALGYEVDGPGTGSGIIVGVVEDFHSGSMADQYIMPLVMTFDAEAANVMLVRYEPGQTTEALGALRNTVRQFNPGTPFEYAFLNAEWSANYADETVLATLSRLFAFMAVLLACLGLLGLAAFSVQLRTKEIGVRRVLGATSQHVVFILSREFIKPVAVALVLALPVSWWIMRDWLSSFAYRVDMSVGTLVLAGTLALMVALATVGMQAWRATRQRPVVLLRHD